MTDETTDLWYVQHGRSEAIGPVETTLLAKGIASGRVPLAARICPVGGTSWMPVATHPAFATAVRELAPPPPITSGATPASIYGKEPEDLDFGDEVKTLVAQSPIDVFSGRNHRPPPPPPVAPSQSAIPMQPAIPLQPPAAGWGPPLPAPALHATVRMPGPSHSAAWTTPTSPGKQQYARAGLIFGITVGVGLLLVAAVILVLVTRVHHGAP